MDYAIAVLMTSHNRKAKTITCLDLLFLQSLPAGHSIDVFLVNDGSTDGTGDAVRFRFPQVTMIEADGSAYWSGGLYLAWQYAAKRDYDFYLWLNDDTYLLPGGIAALLNTSRRCAETGREACIVVASCCDPNTGKHSYGGELVRGHHPGKSSVILPDAHDLKVCDTFNGNCILVPKTTFKKLGVARRFSHAMSDTDYGLYASRGGVAVVLAPGYIAECVSNQGLECPRCAWQNRALSRTDRWRKLIDRRALPPLDWWRFLWAHAGIRAIWYWPRPYLRVLLGL